MTPSLTLLLLVSISFNWEIILLGLDIGGLSLMHKSYQSMGVSFRSALDTQIISSFTPSPRPRDREPISLMFIHWSVYINGFNWCKSEWMYQQHPLFVFCHHPFPSLIFLTLTLHPLLRSQIYNCFIAFLFSVFHEHSYNRLQSS